MNTITAAALVTHIALAAAIGSIAACSDGPAETPIGNIAGFSNAGGAPGASGSGTIAGAPAGGAGAGAANAGSGGTESTGMAGTPATSGAGGTGGTGGSGGAAGSGGAGGSGGTASTCNGAAVCDSFERAMLGPDWVLDNSTASTMIEVVTTKAHTGSSSVHISFGTQSTQSYISEMKSFPAMGNAYWGRAWIFSMVPLGGHQIYVEARVGPGSDKSGVRSFNTFDSNNGYLGLNLESSDASKNSTVKMKTGSWVCYEWQITGIGGSGSFTSWADGVMIGTQMGTIPALMRQRIGIQRYNAGTAGEMWIDDVAIGSERINCTP